MKSVNQVFLLGNLTKDCEVKTLSNNTKVANFTIATSTGGYTKNDGTQVPESTQFHRVVAWRNLAEVAERLFRKGDTVLVQGRVEYSESEKNGVRVMYTDIVAEELSLCHSRNATQQAAQGQPTAIPQQAPAPQTPYSPMVQPVAQRPQVQQIWDGTQYVNAYQDPATGQWMRV